jgi:hypothetical protein
MVRPGVFAPYIGFTEEEVRGLCMKYGRDFEKVKRWYDGYQLGETHAYNPNAVVCLMMEGGFQSYWSDTGTYESIRPLINMDFDGLKTSILIMLAGERVRVRTTSFQNDMVNFRNKDDVITLLIHLGYLSYDQANETAYIPNEEIRREFADAFFDFQSQSARLLDATLDLDGDTVAGLIEKIHNEYASSIRYNDENSLSSVLSIAYLASMQYYFKPVREMPAGRGFADFVFVPKPEYSGQYPALVVELKWNKNVQSALEQVRERKYPAALDSYYGEILLVGINYDKQSKEHQCRIEKI